MADFWVERFCGERSRRSSGAFRTLEKRGKRKEERGKIKERESGVALSSFLFPLSSPTP
jgi:hypothetical protein